MVEEFCGSLSLGSGRVQVGFDDDITYKTTLSP